jgi:hypothetical protein
MLVAQRIGLVTALVVVVVATSVAAATGAGATTPKFLISPTSFDFGAQPLNSPSAQQVVTIKNVSGAPVVMSGAGGGAGIFGGSQDCQGLTIAANASCHMYYQFTPTALGAVTGSTGGNWNGQSFSFHFTGTGTPRFQISPTAFGFGDVPVGTTSAQQLVTITNLGTTSIVMSGAGGGAGIFGGAQDCQGITIAAGHSCHMYYQFHPTTIGAASGSTGGNWNGQQFSFSFTGNGTAGATGDFEPLPATRILDTDARIGYSGPKPAAGQTVYLVVGGAAVPANAAGADLTVTTTDEVKAGSLWVWPCGTSRPAAATITYLAGRRAINHVNAQLGTAGAVCLRSSRSTHLLADLDGYYPSTSGYHPVTPKRILDSRHHTGSTGPKPAAGTVVHLKVTGSTVPAGAAAVALNVGARDHPKGGHVTVWQCGTPAPNASALTFQKKVSTLGLSVSAIDHQGRVCIRTSSSTHLTADVVGWYAAATSFNPVAPQTLVRQAPARPGRTTAITVTGVGAAKIPANAREVVLDLSVGREAGGGYLTLYPCGAARPSTQTVAFAKNEPVTNLALSAIGTSGRVCVRTSAKAHITAQVVGWYGA